MTAAASDDTLAIAYIVRLLCLVRLVTAALALIALLTASDASRLTSILIIILALPLSYFPTRTWNTLGEKISTSGILLACDMAYTAILIAVNGGNQFIYLYAIATASLSGTIVKFILDLCMYAVFVSMLHVVALIP